MTTGNSKLHQGQPVLAAGVPLEQARAAMMMIHGRGASAEDILGLAGEFDGAGFAFLAPQAADATWYPHSFLAPLAQNEPQLSSALQAIGDLLAHIAATGIPAERTVLLGFSQGACLATEFAARNARRYGGVAALSGGLIGADDTPRDYAGALDGTPIFLGCSDIDFHIPKQRVLFSAETLERIGGTVTAKLYRGMGHTINADEIAHVQVMINALR